MRYFTSDTHFGDKRFNLTNRQYITENIDKMDTILCEKWNKVVTNDDTVYHLGDFTVSNEERYLEAFTKRLNGTIILIKGNYDDVFGDTLLSNYFSEVYDELEIEIDGKQFYLNHYPENGKTDMFNIVGHIHEKWKFQRNMINVGCDAWHFIPISETDFLFYYNAIAKYYDINVFAGDLSSNEKTN